MQRSNNFETKKRSEQTNVVLAQAPNFVPTTAVRKQAAPYVPTREAKLINIETTPSTITQATIANKEFKNKFQEPPRQPSSQTRNATIPMMAQIPSTLDCNFSLNETVTSVGRAALNRLMTLDCCRASASRMLTDTVEVNYNPRERGMETIYEKKKVSSLKLEQRGYSKSPPQKIVATSRIVAKEADQEIDDMVTITIDESSLRGVLSNTRNNPAQRVSIVCSCSDCVSPSVEQPVTAGLKKQHTTEKSQACSCSGCGMTTQQQQTTASQRVNLEQILQEVDDVFMLKNLLSSNNDRNAPLSEEQKLVLLDRV